MHCNLDLPYDMEPVIDVELVSGPSGSSFPRQSRTVVFTGLLVRARERPWCLLIAVELELVLGTVRGYGGACVDFEDVIIDRGDKGAGGSASCCRFC